MTIIRNRLVWAAIILGAAFIAVGQGLDKGASWTLVAGLTAMAIVAIRPAHPCC